MGWAPSAGRIHGEEYLAMYDENREPFVWTKTADEILRSVASFFGRTPDSGH
jgi:hypothetical protein